MTFDQFTSLDHIGIFDRCVRKLRAEYPAADAENYVAFAMLQLTLEYDKVDAVTVEGWVYKVALHELFRCEKRNRETAADFSLGIEDPSFDLDPIQRDIQRMHRERQAGALSDTLRTFKQECEQETPTIKSGKQVWVALRRSECMERHFFGQKDVEIASAMRQYCSNSDPMNLIAKDRSRAWDRIEEIKQTHDVRQTLFTADPKRGRAAQIQEVAPAQPLIPVKSKFEGENPPRSVKAALDTMLLTDWFPDVTTSKILYILLIRDTQAYCPSENRLAEFRMWHAASHQPIRETCPEEFLDIWYHALERQCRFCTDPVV